MEEKIKLIQDYLDGNLDTKSTEMLMEEMKTNPELKLEFDKMIQLDDFLTVSIKPMDPGPTFSENIMISILNANGKIFNWRGLILFIGIVVLLFISSLGLSGLNSFGGPTTINEIAIPYLNHNIPSITYTINWELISNGLLFIGFIASMLLLDISVLRPYLKRDSY